MDLVYQSVGVFDVAIAIVAFHAAVIYFAVIGVRKTIAEARAGRETLHLSRYQRAQQ